MMEITHCSQQIEGVAAPQQGKGQVLPAYMESVNADFYRDVVAWIGGERDLRVGVIRTGGRDTVEVFGFLPPPLRAGLRRARAYWERLRPGCVPWSDAAVVWHTSLDGYGPRFAVPGLGALIDLLAERQLAMEAGQA
jgi:hypothetical protein